MEREIQVERGRERERSGKSVNDCYAASYGASGRRELDSSRLWREM